MTNTPDTSPGAVERLAYRVDDAQCISGCGTMKFCMCAYAADCVDTLRALSAERDRISSALERTVLACGEQARARGEAEGKLAAFEMAGVVDGWKARAEAAEAERDALKAELAEAVERLALCHAARVYHMERNC